MKGKGIVVAVIVVSALGFFYVWQRTHVIQLGYDVETLKAQKKKLDQIHNHLLIESSTLASLERIERIATSSLGMKKPEIGQVVMLDDAHTAATASTPPPDTDAPFREDERPEVLRVAQVAPPIPGVQSMDGGPGLSLLQRIKNAF
jgi:cell division protein FtsL